MQDRIRNHIRSNVVGYVALFFALSMSTAYATHPGGENTISSGDIINGEVRNSDIGGNAVGSGEINDGAVRDPDIRNGAVNSAKVNNDSLTGEDVANNSLTDSELGTASVGSDEVADDSLRAIDLAADSVGSSELGLNSVDSTNVVSDSLFGSDIAHDSVTGTEIDESTLNVSEMGCQVGQPGTIHGFARITNVRSIPVDFTTSGRHIDRAYNCAGGEISVRASGFTPGRYEVRFAGNPSTLPFTTTERGDLDNFVTSQLANEACAGDLKAEERLGVYCIYTKDNDGDSQHGPFKILLP